jgi:hypothetical protein
MQEITLRVGAIGEGENEAALGVNDARGALGETIAQGADTFERPEASAGRGVGRSRRRSTHLKLAPEGMGDEVAEPCRSGCRPDDVTGLPSPSCDLLSPELPIPWLALLQ